MTTMSPEDEIIDWAAMTAPPTFQTTLHDPSGVTVVATFGVDFPTLASTWATASPETRCSGFWAVGLVHVCEVELMRLPAEARTEAVSIIGDLKEDEPAALAKALARAVREVRVTHGVVPQKMSPEEAVVYRKLLAVRASGPYSGPGPDEARFVCLRRGG